MSRADLEILRAGYEAFNRGDWDFVFRYASPDFELRTADRVTNPGTYRGLEEAKAIGDVQYVPELLRLKASIELRNATPGTPAAATAEDIRQAARGDD